MSETRDPATDQQLPARNNLSVDVFRHLCRTLGHSKTDVALRHALRERADHGRRKYGDTLHSFNGRDALRDAWEEALDLLAYCTQLELEEGNAPVKEAREIARRLTWKRLLRGDLDTNGA